MNKIFVLSLAALASLNAFANVPANHCEISIRRIMVGPSSHGSSAMTVRVKVGWLGNGETIQRVGFYGYQTARNEGNQANCHMSPLPGSDGQRRIMDPETYPHMDTEYGEYQFHFPIESGSVEYRCPGYEYSTVGSFFVETDRNTYWVNPDMDSSKSFYFDKNGYNNINRRAGYFNWVYTDRSELKYYNPQSCRN